jgi:hypothetical protein
MTDSKAAWSRRTLSQIFALPFVLAVLSAVGLVSALLGDGVWDGLSWLALATPVAIPVYCIARGRSRTELR